MPRKFLRPRSMQTPSREQHPFWDIVSLELVASMLMVAAMAFSPLRASDAWFDAQILTAMGSRAPPRRVLVATVPQHLVPTCRAVLESSLRQGGARGVVFVPPVAGLCGITEQRLVGLPVLYLAAGTLQRPADDSIVGFTPRPVDHAAFAALGLHDSSWVAPRQFRSMPTSSIADFVEGRVPSSALRGRVVVVALDDSFRDDARGDTFLPVRIGAAVAGALEDRRRRVASPLATVVATAVAAMVLAMVYRRKRLPPWVRRVTQYGLGVILLGAAVAGAFGHGVLVPIPSTLFALALFFGTRHLPGYVAARRADTNATEMLAQARTVGSGASHELSDEEFWNRITKRAEYSHPADNVLIAELPPFAWRLRVHPNGDLNESIIRERRRDIRRFPFSDDNGQRPIRIHRGFLVMADVPTVIVPLEVQGEPEGYLFLIGKTAESAFLARPELTKQLGNGIAALVRHRRIERLRADDWRRPGGVLVHRPSDRASEIMVGARAALDRLELFKALVVSAPVGLLYADSFGDVRLLTQSISNTLAAFGMQVPPLGDSGALEPGALALTDVLETLSREAGIPEPTLEEITDSGTSLQVAVPALSVDMPSERSMLFVVKRFERQGTPGFVASMVEVVRNLEVLPGNVERLPERGDPLVVFSLSESLQELAANIASRINGNIRLQSPRFLGHVVAHRQELLGALVDFLIEAASAAGPPGPTIVLKEHARRVELSILDLRLGAPPAALKRTLLAPSEPPPGMRALGDLTRAVENSHGNLSLRAEEGWSTQITASFIRANPRVVVRSPTEPVPRVRRLRKLER